ncbi:hypothetical protein EA472_12925 [Natrarchaeobius oligotrophus]|uniref:Uncharacterized protein n=1 Tax=Natrarchaeobius chitinivorans TaxID=1679083 RepID=A0A3N6M8R0_NATCH|nr:hypothetical protein EA472_12925 [Natrarchaeobius chitinivorans]
MIFYFSNQWDDLIINKLNKTIKITTSFVVFCFQRVESLIKIIKPPIDSCMVGFGRSRQSLI